MNKLIYCVAAISMAFGSMAFADSSSNSGSDHPPKTCATMRMDCRFYGEHNHSCVASATYQVKNGHEIHDIRYGVSCDRQTIYNNGGTYMPQEQVSDGIRPNTAAVPRVELFPQFALRNSGTYTSKLENSEGQFLNGVCYVNELESHEIDNGDNSSDESSDSDSSSNSGSSSGSHSYPYPPVPSPTTSMSQ